MKENIVDLFKLFYDLCVLIKPVLAELADFLRVLAYLLESINSVKSSVASL